MLMEAGWSKKTKLLYWESFQEWRKWRQTIFRICNSLSEPQWNEFQVTNMNILQQIMILSGARKWKHRDVYIYVLLITLLVPLFLHPWSFPSVITSTILQTPLPESVVRNNRPLTSLQEMLQAHLFLIQKHRNLR